MAEPFVRFTVTDDFRRSRLTVFFRLFLAIPTSSGGRLVDCGGARRDCELFATLVTGRPPDALHRF
jgi:hypothetical protein